MRAVASRPLRVVADHERVCRFLRHTHAAFGRPRNWSVARWEVTRYLLHWEEEVSGRRTWEVDGRVWEDENGRLVGIVHPEGANTAHAQVHPDHRDLEPAMFSWAMAHHVDAGRSGHPLRTEVATADTVRIDTLRTLGWMPTGHTGCLLQRVLAADDPVSPAHESYTVRALDPDRATDLEGRAAVANAAFGHDRNTADRIRSLLRAPSHRPELHLLAVAHDGTVAAVATAWLDEENAMVELEPVATHPDHRRRGLASAAITEALRRGRALGADVAYVFSADPSPGRDLYEALGFALAERYEEWEHRPPGSEGGRPV